MKIDEGHILQGKIQKVVFFNMREKLLETHSRALLLRIQQWMVAADTLQEIINQK